MTTGLRRKDLPSLPMAPPAGRQPTAKICLIGDERVGKTSLIQRFVHGVYSPAYLRPRVAGVRDIVGPVPAILLANKVDLVQERRVSADEIDPVAKEFGMAWYPASALTGENVEAAFRELAVLCRRNQLGSPSS